MRAALLASFLLALPSAPCLAKKPRKAAADPDAIRVSTSAAGTVVPVLEPSTAPITAALVLARFQDFDARMESLALSFRQSVRLEEAGAVQTKEGEVLYLKPRRLRIEYRAPEPQTVVSDGRLFWVWRPATNQVIESTFEDWRKAEPAIEGLLNFGDYGSLLKRYEVAVATVSAFGPDGHRVFQLDLKPRARDADFVLTLTISTRDFFPYEARLAASGAIVQTSFQKVRFNPAIPKAGFEFVPPKDAEVFRYPTGP